ncbi:hypothetical protein A8B98_18700 [Hymenobacter sp. UV11]|nr:hypothetical protein A8B98_18700 [Hymenobacter sp. UV11]
MRRHPAVAGYPAGHLARLALELGALPMAELVGVEVVRVSAHQAVDAQPAHSVEELAVLLVGHLVVIDEALALAAVERVGWVAVNDDAAEFGAL